MSHEAQITGQCYCGHVTLSTSEAAQVVAYCHCADCKRWTGAPAPAFAAFADHAVVLRPDIPEKSFAKGVWRRACPECGSPLTARFDYLPDQTYIPLGVLDQGEELAPQLHCHAESAYPWALHDDLPREGQSARALLSETGQ